MIRVIGLSGFAGSGKTTAAKHLVEAHGFVTVKFAGPLKAMMRALGLGEREIEGDLKEVSHHLLAGKTPRYAMQTLGTEWGRAHFGDDFWVNLARETVLDVLDQGGHVVIDDVRFANEAAAIVALGGAVLRVDRPGVGPVNAHASDNQHLAWDYEITNDDSIAVLHTALDAIVWQLERRCA